MQSQVQTLPLPQSKPVTELLTDDELSAYDNAGKSTEQTIPVLNDFLQKLATLDSAMIGGGLLIAKGDILPIQFGIFALLILTASLLCAIIGLYPRKVCGDRNALGGLQWIQDREIRIAAAKGWLMFASVSLVAVAFLVSIAGVAAKEWIMDKPPAPIQPIGNR